MMDNKLACLMDWDLQAIVGGCTNEAPAAIIHNPHPNFSYFCYEQDHDLLRSFPAFSETTSVLDELEEPRKPSYPVLHPLSTQTTIPSSVPIPNEVKASDKVLDSKDLAASRCKRSKKNQHKRVVKQVTADGLCDAGAWRKYGQKPIKGSPYPRSYYRCSSSKGCAARKQVERSHLDPEVFIVTYTAEHSHHHSTRPWRTRKNKDSIAPETTQHTCSPRTPLVESIVDELVPSGQSEGLNKGEDLLVLSEDAPVTANILGSDDWFPSIEELNELSQEFALFMDTFAET